MAMARAGKLIEVADELFVFFVHPNRHGDVALRDTVRAMAEETGVEAFLRQQQAIMGRPEFAAEARRHSMSDIDAGR